MNGSPSRKVVALQMAMGICSCFLTVIRGKIRPTQRAPDLKRARQTLTVNLIPSFQAGNANRYVIHITFALGGAYSAVGGVKLQLRRKEQLARPVCPVLKQAGGLGCRPCNRKLQVNALFSCHRKRNRTVDRPALIDTEIP